MSGNNSGWNRPAGNQPTAKKRGTNVPAKWKGVAAGLAVAVPLIALCIFLFSGKDEMPEEKSGKERGRIKEVTPAKAPTNAVVEVKKPKGPKPIPPSVKRDENGILRWPSGARYIKDYYFHTNSVNPYAGQKQLFKRGSDIHIATIINLKPGQMVIGGFEYGKEFDEEFKASLEEKIEFKEDDTEEERLLKEDVLAAREQLKEAMAQGKKPSQVMQEIRDEMVKLFQYKQNLAEQIAMFENEEGHSEEDRLDFTEAANLMLKEHGISEFSTEVIKRRIKRMKEREEHKE